MLPLRQALQLAQDAGLDLVETDPLARPPVCTIMEHGKFVYAEGKRRSRERKGQVAASLREVRLRPRTDVRDFGLKIGRIRKFLEGSSRVRVTVELRGRELTRPESGAEVLDRVLADLGEIAIVEAPPGREGRRVSMVLGPGPRRPPRPPGAPQEAALVASGR